MWNLTQHKSEKGQQYLRVKILLGEMSRNTYATYSDEFIRSFNERIKEIPRSNNFSANLFYRATPINSESLEIWKLTVSGDYKDKLFTVDLIKKATE